MSRAQGPLCLARDNGDAPVDQDFQMQPSTGRYRIWPANNDGQLISEAGVGHIPRSDEAPDPYRAEAVEMFFGLLASTEMPPREQLELQSAVDKMLRAIQRIYPDSASRQRSFFRIYYVRLFNAARVGLEGIDASPELAQLELARITADLLDDEGGNVKNAHLRKLGRYAALYSVVPILTYALVCLYPWEGLDATLHRLYIEPDWLKSFCMLWVGCFNGVWLSYGIRKSKITLSDLLVGDEDRMQPQIRLLFAASLASAFGLMFALKIVDVRLGVLSLSDITGEPSLAFLVGLLLGVGELALPAKIGGRSGTLTAKL